MNKIVKAHSVNCQSCNREVLNYQIRPSKVGSILMDLCSVCHKATDAYKQFVESAKILNELYKAGQLNNDPQTASPSVLVEPLDSNIQAAVELLKRMDGSFFVGVSKIIAGPEANYGHASSTDPTVVHINLGRIVSETKKDNSKRNIISALAETIAHEVGHIKSFDSEKGFVGNESPALAMEQKVNNWIKANESRLQDLFS
jgi:hypothetical protein